MSIAMSDVFISHAEPDEAVARALAAGLEEAGYTTWYYERDSVPGPSYLIQTGQAIEAARAVVLLISMNAVVSHQVTKEVVRAHEAGKPFIPVLCGLSHAEFQMHQPEWREAVGAHTSIALPAGGAGEVLPRLIRGLKALGVDSTAAARAPSAAPPSGATIASTVPGASAGTTPKEPLPQTWVERFTITPDAREQLLDVVERVKAQLRALGHDQETIDDAEFISRELVENALEHGCRGQANPRVDLEVRISSNYFKCVVEDNGPGYDVKEVIQREEREASDISRIRGRGLLLVQKKADELEYSPSGNRLAATLRSAKHRGRVSGEALDAGLSGLEAGEAAVVRVEGKLDSSSLDRFMERMERVLRGGPTPTVILDLAQCSFISSAGLGCILRARAKLGGEGRLIIAGAHGAAKAQFEMLQLDKVLQFSETVDEARRLLTKFESP